MLPQASRARASPSFPSLARTVLWLGLIVATCLTGAAACRAATWTLPGAEEFVGPLASWVDVKRAFGAVGDGRTDDTAALQKALDSLRPPESPRRVLYLPAGTYRITRTLHVTRTQHAESMDVMILGED